MKLTMKMVRMSRVTLPERLRMNGILMCYGSIGALRPLVCTNKGKLFTSERNQLWDVAFLMKIDAKFCSSMKVFLSLIMSIHDKNHIQNFRQKDVNTPL